MRPFITIYRPVVEGSRWMAKAAFDVGGRPVEARFYADKNANGWPDQFGGDEADEAGSFWNLASTILEAATKVATDGEVLRMTRSALFSASTSEAVNEAVRAYAGMQSTVQSPNARLQQLADAASRGVPEAQVAAAWLRSCAQADRLRKAAMALDKRALQALHVIQAGVASGDRKAVEAMLLLEALAKLSMGVHPPAETAPALIDYDLDESDDPEDLAESIGAVVKQSALRTPRNIALFHHALDSAMQKVWHGPIARMGWRRPAGETAGDVMAFGAVMPWTACCGAGRDYAPLYQNGNSRSGLAGDRYPFAA